MGKLHELRKRSDTFIANINVQIELSIMAVDDSLLKMNKANLLNSKDSNQNPLIHASTGSEYLTNLYAIRTGKSKPNLFLSGEFQKAMFLEVNENNLTFFIDSADSKAGILTKNYGNEIFGIAQKDTNRAKKLTLDSFKRRYKSQVFKK